MTEEDAKKLLIGGGIAAGLYLAFLVRRERKKRDQTVKWMIMTIGCIHNLSERIEEVMEDPEHTVGDLVDALYAETAFLNIMLDENPNPMFE